MVEFARPIAITLEEIKQESGDNEEIQKVISALKLGEWREDLKGYKPFADELCVIDGIVLRGFKMVMPPSLRKRTIELAHEGHQGMVAMKARIRSKVWWPGMDKEVEKYVQAYKQCTLVSLPSRPEPLNPTKVPTEAWEAVAIDFKGPLPTGDSLLVLVDYFSKFTIAEWFKSTTVTILIDCLRKTFANFGPPYSIRADNGPQFSSEEFKEFCKEFDIVLIHTTPYWPQANGEVERMNRTIEKCLQISRSQGSNLKNDLNTFLRNFHATPHSVTGKTPGELMWKRKVRDKIPEMQIKESVNEEVRDKMTTKKMEMKDYVDRKRKAATNDITIGDEVLLWNTKKKNKMDTNFDPEEYEVIERKGGEVTVKSKQDGNVKKRKVTHTKKIKKASENDNKSNREEPKEVKEMGKQNEESQSTSAAETSSERPRRQIRAPARYEE